LGIWAIVIPHTCRSKFIHPHSSEHQVHFSRNINQNQPVEINPQMQRNFNRGKNLFDPEWKINRTGYIPLVPLLYLSHNCSAGVIHLPGLPLTERWVGYCRLGRADCKLSMVIGKNAKWCPKAQLWNVEPRGFSKVGVTAVRFLVKDFDVDFLQKTESMLNYSCWISSWDFYKFRFSRLSRHYSTITMYQVQRDNSDSVWCILPVFRSLCIWAWKRSPRQHLGYWWRLVPRYCQWFSGCQPLESHRLTPGKLQQRTSPA